MLQRGTDSQHEALIAKIDMEMAVNRDERLLNDATLYDFGDCWEHILDSLLELITNQDKNTSSQSESLQKAEDTFHKAPAIL